MATLRPQRALPRRWLAALLGLATLLWLAGCATLTQPDALRVNVVGVEPLPGQGMELRFAVKLRVQNPNDLGVDYDGVAVDLELNGKNLATGVSDAKGSVPRFGETVIVVPVSISAFAALRQVLGYADASQRGEIPYTVSGKLAGSLFGSVRFSHSGTLKLPQSGGGTAARPAEG
jgi:LEA14-like dessication related protein